MRRIAASMMIVLLFGACASNDLAEQGDRSRASRPEREKDEKKERGEKAPGSSVAEQTEDIVEKEVEAPGEAEGAVTEDAPQDFGGGDAPTGGVDQSLARASIAVSDSGSDAKKQGLSPEYTEATGAAIQGLGNNVRFVMSFSGNVPTAVQKGQYMVMAFGITGRNDDEGFAIGATCDENGWKPYAGTKGDSQKFPGTFDVTGSEIVMELPWSFIKGPRAFEWYASTGWYGKVANQTHWSFDSVPNGKAGDFPR